MPAPDQFCWEAFKALGSLGDWKTSDQVWVGAEASPRSGEQALSGGI